MFTSPSARAMLPVASMSSMEGSATPLGWLWQSTTVSVPPLMAAATTSLMSRLTRSEVPSRSQTAARTRLRLSRLTSMARS